MSGIGLPMSGGGDGRDDHHRTVHVEQAHVAIAATEVAAEVVAATLAAHGVQAMTHAYFHAYPSVDWVEGYRVAVAEEDAEEARRILRDLSSEDAVALGPDGRPVG